LILLTLHEFISKWQGSTLNERQSYQAHFADLWSLATASMHGVGNDPTYNAKSCFETFPFPVGLAPTDTPTPSSSPLSGGEQSRGTEGEPRMNSSPDKGRLGGVKELGEAIAAAAQTLNTLRNA